MKVTFRCPPELEGLIPAPIMSRRGLPAWLRHMPNTAHSNDLDAELETVKQCPPFLDAMGAGFLMPLAVDLHVADGAFTWDWEPPAGLPTHYPRSPFAFHVPEQLVGTPMHDPDRFAVKFINFWTIALPAGWGLLCTHPANRADLPFRTVTGLVRADNYDTFIHFPALWNDHGFAGTLPRGTPVAQCYPVPLEPLDLETGTITGEAAERFLGAHTAPRDGQGAYRRHHRRRD